MKQVQKSRWDIAQEAEKSFWIRKYPKEKILCLERKYSRKSDFIMNECNGLNKSNKNPKILQIGCAALDAINYINVGKKYALDPLADFYKENFKVDYSQIDFKKGVAEKLPYKDNFFDIIVFTNVLDHVQNPEKALSEIQRVLKKEGLLYFEIDFSSKGFILIYNSWKFLNKIFGRVFNKPHPHIFSIKNVEDILSKRFKVIKKFKVLYRNQGFTLNLLRALGFSSNNYYRAFLIKKGEKNEN